MTTTTISAIPSSVVNFYEKAAVKQAIPLLCHGKFGEAPVLKTGAGTTYVWHKWTNMDAITTALDNEGTTPAAQSYSVSELTAAPDPYGGYVRYTEEFNMSDPDGGVTKISKQLGIQAGISIDTIIRNTICAGYTAQYADGVGGRSSVNTVIDFDDILDAIAGLIVAGAQPFDNGRYQIVLHPYVWADLMADTDFKSIFQNAAERGANNPYMRGYIGDALMCDWYVTYNAYTIAGAGASSKDVYTTLFFGKGAYGTCGLGTAVPTDLSPAGTDMKQATDSTVNPVAIKIKKDGTDPFDRISTIAWLVRMEAKILMATFVRGYECSLT